MSISRPIHFVRKDDKTWDLGPLKRQARGTEKNTAFKGSFFFSLALLQKLVETRNSEQYERKRDEEEGGI